MFATTTRFLADPLILEVFRHELASAEYRTTMILQCRGYLALVTRTAALAAVTLAVHSAVWSLYGLRWLRGSCREKKQLRPSSAVANRNTSI